MKIIYTIIIGSVFLYGCLVGRYEVFPFSHLKNIQDYFFPPPPPQQFNPNCDLKEIYTIPSNSVIVAGHLYIGESHDKSQEYFISRKFQDFIELNKRQIKHLFLNGDILRFPSHKKWSKLKNYFEENKINFTIAPGNHDVQWGDNAYRDIFIEHFPEYKILQKFEFDNIDIFVEDSTINNWKLNTDLISIINKNKYKKNVLIRHHVIINEMLPIANSLEGYDGKLNTINELSEIIKNNLIVISGDSQIKEKFSCISYKNIQIVSNGFDESSKQNPYVIVINNDKLAKFKI